MANTHSIAEISKNATVVENDFGRQISNTGNYTINTNISL